MTVQEARGRGVCRVCGKSIDFPPGQPKGWYEGFRERTFPPPAVTLDFGDEFAHSDCLKAPEGGDKSDAAAGDERGSTWGR